MYRNVVIESRKKAGNTGKWQSWPQLCVKPACCYSACLGDSTHHEGSSSLEPGEQLKEPLTHSRASWSTVTRKRPGGPSLCPAEHYLIDIRTRDPVSSVTIWAGSTLESIPGVCASDTSETRAGVTAARRASWGCWRSDGHQGVWGWGLKAERT